MYQVLYRKWRPKVFEDVVGQNQVTVTLRNELKSGRISHAYLFTGSRGTGKTTCAKILAKAVNCLSPINGDPCGECSVCRGIEEGAVLDISEIDAASNNGVDNIRDIRDEVSYTPATCKYRVFIIDEVHMLSPAAFNALLKTLEEPPEHVIFILATTEVNKLPATILSRCQRFDFRRIPVSAITERLLFIASKESVSLSDGAASMIAELADGALRDALSILDQCMGISDKIDEETVETAAGIAGSAALFSIAGAVIDRDSETALSAVDKLYSGSKDIVRLCEELALHFRALMLVKIMKDASPILQKSAAHIEKLKQQGERTELSFILRVIDVFREAGENMTKGANKRTELEMAVIRLAVKELDASPEALLRRIEALERGISVPVRREAPKAAPQKAEIPAAPVQKAYAAPLYTELEPPETEASENVPSGDFSPENEPMNTEPPENKLPQNEPPQKEILTDSLPDGKFTDWQEVISIIKGYSQSVAAAFSGSSAYISGGYFLIDAPNKMAFELLRKPTQRDKMRDAIKKVTGRVYKLGPYKKPEAVQETDGGALSDFIKKAEDMGIDVKLN